jgi:hypothetical protein
MLLTKTAWYQKNRDRRLLYPQTFSTDLNMRIFGYPLDKVYSDRSHRYSARLDW